MNTGLFQDTYLYIPGLTNWAVGSLVVDNCRFVFGQPGLVVTITNDLTITNSGALGLMGNALLTCSNLAVRGGGYLSMFAGPTNATLNYGALVTLAGSMNMTSGSWVYAYSDSTNGGSPLFQIAQNLNVSSGIHIILAGGAQAANIFWQVAGQTTLGTTAAFNGTPFSLR